jgi:DNA-binding transcriptional LysR family regulator
MEVRRFRTFEAVARTGSFARAAEDLNFTPSAVSQAIARLEKEAGSRLLERDRRGVRLTAAGETLLPRAVAVLGQVDRAHRDLAALRSGALGLLRLGTLPTAAAGLAAPALARFRSEHPGVDVRLATADIDHLLEMLRARDLDLAVVAAWEEDPAAAADVDRLPLMEEPFILAMHGGHPLARHDRIDPSSLRDERFVGSPGWPGLSTLTAALRLEHVTLRFDGLRSNDFHVAQTLAALGQGIALIPALARSPGLGELAFRRLARLEPSRRLAIAFPAGDAATTGARAMVDVLRERAQEIAADLTSPLRTGGKTP